MLFSEIPGNAQSFPGGKYGLEWLYLSGPDAEATNGDFDHLQLIYFVLPDSSDEKFCIEFTENTDWEDPKCITDCKIELNVYGNNCTGIELNEESGDCKPIYSEIIGGNMHRSDGILPQSGEYCHTLKSWIFKIEIKGIEGKSGKYYSISAKQINESNSETHGSFYSNKICFEIPSDQISIPVYIPATAEGISYFLYNLDNQDNVKINSKRRNGQIIRTRGKNLNQIAMLNIFSDEKEDDIILHISGVSEIQKNITIEWIIQNENGIDISLPFFHCKEFNINKKRKNESGKR